MRCLVLCIILFISNLLTAQSDIKWGKVPKEDLAMTQYGKDSTAEAVILGDFMQAKFELIGENFGIEYKFHKRIKILKESGFNWGDVELYYQHFNNREKLLGLKAQIIQPDGSKISLSKKDIFRKEVSKYNTKVSFAFPQIQVGSVIEWTYNVNSLNFTFIDDKYFQYSIPCRSSVFFAELPKVFDYVQITQGPIQLKTEKKQAFNNYNWGDEAIHYTFSAVDVPALKRERFITTMNDYRSRLRIQLSAINIPGDYQPIMSNWIKVGDDLLDDSNLGRQCFRKGNYNQILENLGALKGSSDKEKLEEIFAYVIKKMSWNESFGVYANEPLNKAFQKQSGNGAVLNLITIALLNEHGINAQPALISTRTHGSPMPLYPVMRQFNHLIARLEVDGKIMFIDVSDDLKSVECLRINSLNGKAFVIEKGNSRWEEIIPKMGVDTYYFAASIDEDGNISGLFKGRYLGYNTSPERRAFKNDVSGGHWQTRLEEKYPEIEISDVKYEGLDDPSAPFVDGFNFTIEEAWTDAGDKIYLDPIMFTAQLTENPFKLKERSYPVDIPYPFRENYVFNLTLPEGYKVEIPAPTRVSLPNKAGRFTYTITQTENKIQLVSNFYINQLKFDSDYYSSLKAFYDLAIEKYQEQLVIIKE